MEGLARELNKYPDLNEWQVDGIHCRDRLRPIGFPKPAVGSWYNAYDPKDVVALYPLGAQNFPVSPAVENYGRVLNGTDNRHGIIGYLDDADVAKHILNALSA